MSEKKDGKKDGMDEFWEAQRLYRCNALIADAMFPRMLRIAAKDVTKLTAAPTFRAALEEVKSAAKDVGAVVVVTGKRGVGKSQLAVMAGMDVCMQGERVLYTVWHELVERFHSCRQSAAVETSSDVFRELKGLGLLILDEVRPGIMNEHEVRMLTTIVSDRHDEGLPTFLVTNENLVELDRSLDASILDRARGSGGVVVMTGKSFRGLDHEGTKAEGVENE